MVAGSRKGPTESKNSVDKKIQLPKDTTKNVGDMKKPQANGSSPPSRDDASPHKATAAKAKQMDSAPAGTSISDDDSSGEISDESPLNKTALPSLPLIPLAAGLHSKESALSAGSWVALALTLDGRDKITKMLQYLSRLLAFCLAASRQPQHAKRFAALKVSLTNSRKAFRLGRTYIELYRLHGVGVVQSLVNSFQTHKSDNSEQSVSIARPLSSLACRFYQAILSQLGYVANDCTSSSKASTPFLMVLGSAGKLLGLAGFWAADNLNFLAMSGLLDNYQLDSSERRFRRERLQSRSAIFANRSYFMGALAGLYVTFRSYYNFRQEQLCQLQQTVADGEDAAIAQLEQAKAKQFSLFTALLKSVCDVLVFSNNPGLDFWQTYRGHKMHEGFHCLCGLTSAATVLYNNYPDAKNK